ncbi:hypothetical protein [Streptomyces cyaneofuscatus]|uniref:hypothetical protein n=1 Tax=Streptomyces cyaneofuscatus TaxID=66883 RepID=UPI0037A87EA7
MGNDNEVTDVGEIPSTVISSETTDVPLISESEIKPEDIGSLSLRYADGVPVLVVSGGTVIPAGLTVVDASGDVVGAYSAEPVRKTRTYASLSQIEDGFNPGARY